MTTTAATIFGLVAVIALALVAVTLGGDDDDDVDVNEYSDWERLR